MPLSTLRHNIKYLRTLSKRTQKKVADYMGIPRTSVGHWETGAFIPCTWHLHCLSNLFQISIDDLCRRDLLKIK